MLGEAVKVFPEGAGKTGGVLTCLLDPGVKEGGGRWPQRGAVSEAHSTLIHKVGNTTPCSAVSSAFYFMGDCTVCLSVCPQVFFRPPALPADSCFKTKPSAPTLLVASQGPLTPWPPRPALCLVGGDSAWRQTSFSPPPNFLFMSPSLPPSPGFHPILTLLGGTQVEPTDTREAQPYLYNYNAPGWCLYVLNTTEAAQPPPLKPSVSGLCIRQRL